MERIQKSFLWPSKPKIKNQTLCSDFKHGGLKIVNMQKNSKSSMLLGEKIVWGFFPWMGSNTVETYKKNPLDHILNFTVIFYSISPVLMIFHPFT